MTLNRDSKFLLVSFVAVLVVVALAGIPSGMRAGVLPQKAETTMQDCAACHEDAVKAFSKNAHDVLEKSSKYKLENPCESCHGPGKAHIDGGGDKTKIINFKGKANKTYNQQCLACHKGDHEVTGFGSSTHAKQGLDCADCHNVHKAAPGTRLLKERASNLCMSCHTQQKTDFAKPFHHRVKEGAIECVDCHQPHSGLDKRLLRSNLAGQEICFKCHSEKQGPYLFEHPAIRLRGCQGCHEPHGSNNPKMLVRNTMTGLCLECHSRAPYATSVILGSQPPSFHNLNSPTYRNCLTCHVMIHGSNSSKLFLR
jgi:DmsE family decaheme c-type cytochrome